MEKKMTKGTVFETLSTIKIDKKDIEKKVSLIIYHGQLLGIM